ncbi:MAG: hypothetical protein ABL876_11820 [Chitinophagaceae bacterium]
MPCDTTIKEKLLTAPAAQMLKQGPVKRKLLLLHRLRSIFKWSKTGHKTMREVLEISFWK